MTQMTKAALIPQLYFKWLVLKQKAFKDTSFVKSFDNNIHQIWIEEHFYIRSDEWKDNINYLISAWETIYDLLMDTDNIIDGEQKQKLNDFCMQFDKRLNVFFNKTRSNKKERD